MSTSEPFDSGLSVALLDFDKEAVVYCEGLSDTSCHEYALNFTRALQSRAKGMEVDRIRIPSGLFAPNRGLIEASLTRIYRKYFPRLIALGSGRAPLHLRPERIRRIPACTASLRSAAG